MGTLTIYGASDDLIEFNGDFEDEGNHYGDDPAFVHLDDGSVIKALYDQDGIWRLDPVKLADGTTVAKHEKGDVEQDTPDRLTLKRSGGKFKSFRVWKSDKGPSKQEIRDAVEQWFDNNRVDEIPDGKLRQIYDLICDIR